MEIWLTIKTEILPYWSFLVMVLFCSVVGQLLKARVLTVHLASKVKAIFWLRRVLPLLLILIAGLVGVLWPGEAGPGVVKTLQKILYFSGSACVSIVGYSVFRNWIKKKYDIDINESTAATLISYPLDKK
jgi:hypothetical protein